MKNLIIVFIALAAFGHVAMSQTKGNAAKIETAKIIVLVNTAAWCPVCKTNGQRVEQNVLAQYMENSKYQIVVNDLSNKKTKAASQTECTKAGIAEVALENKGTGVIYFINAVTKEVIAQISVSKTDEEIKKAFEDAISKV